MDTTNTNILTIHRSEAVRMVGLAHRAYEWEVAEYVTRLVMLFGPEPLGDDAKLNDVVVLDRLTCYSGWMWSRVRDCQKEAAEYN